MFGHVDRTRVDGGACIVKVLLRDVLKPPLFIYHSSIGRTIPTIDCILFFAQATNVAANVFQNANECIDWKIEIESSNDTFV